LNDFGKALEIASTGVGVVFVALAGLTLVTTLLTKYIKGDKAPITESPDDTLNYENFPSEITGDDDPMVVAAMVAATQVIQANLPQVEVGAVFTKNVPAVGVWRSQGRQMLMQSQGSSINPRMRRK
tara:strand:- start:158 stop:535 length:378 start_codon:yes stop_codon:yes gene_type:complete